MSCDCQTYENCPECTPAPELARISALHDRVVKLPAPSPPTLAIAIDLSHLDSLMKEHIRERCHTDTIDEGILRGFYLSDLLLWIKRRQEKAGVSRSGEE